MEHKKHIKSTKPESPWTTSKLSNSCDIISHLQANMMFDLTDDVFLGTTKLVIISWVTHELTQQRDKLMNNFILAGAGWTPNAEEAKLKKFEISTLWLEKGER